MQARQVAPRAVVAIIFVACGTPPTKTPAPVVGPGDVELTAQMNQFIDAHLAFRPSFAIELGLHEYDGKVPDRSRAAIDAEVARLKTALAQFEAVDVARLSHDRQVEREVVLAEIRKELFELETRRRPFRDPFFYLFKFSLNSYIAREYAPAPVRAAAMLKACLAAPAYYEQAAQNLDERLPEAFVQAGMGMAKATMGFLTKDAKQAFANVPDTGKQLEVCLDALAKQVGAFGAVLEARMATATDEFRLGGETLIAMLRTTEGIDMDLPALERMAKADLEKNRAAIVEAAKQIDPKRDVTAVVAEVSADKPPIDKVLVEATEQLKRLKRFLSDKSIVSMPREDLIEVRASPSFMRGNFAALGGVGPFEKTPLPSYYYIAPPDPSWPPIQQHAYVMSRADMLFTSAHEVYPGHFITGMHQRASGSRVMQTFETYTSSEGWAHYVEEMMWEQGLGDRDPRAHIGQLKNALLRDVRFVVALGYHAGTMTPDEAMKLFVEQAFADPANAKQQAIRGTVDPMFLGYALGKLLIMQLRADWRAANPTKSLKEFHDEFLSYGEAPLPVTRKMMLGPSAVSAEAHDIGSPIGMHSAR